MSKSFQNLATVKNVQIPLKPAAMRIYGSIFPNCRVEDLRQNGVKVHVLDKEFGIDSLIHLESGQWFSIQEKYRDYPKYDHHDFTQEIENGNGTPGEWYSLASQLYFYGWGDPRKNIFMEWFILDVAQYKLIVERKGGIEKCGKKKQNQEHGSSWFVPVHFETIFPAIIYFGNGMTYLKRANENYFHKPRLLPRLERKYWGYGTGQF